MKIKEAILENLKRKFEAVREHKNDNPRTLFIFTMEYIDFVCSSKELAPAIKKLIMDSKMVARPLQYIYSDYVTGAFLRDYDDSRYNHIKFPEFYDEDVEHMLNLHKKFCQIFNNDYETTKNHPELIRVDCDKGFVRAGCNEIQIFHNGLLEELELNRREVSKTMGKKLNFYPESGEAEYLTAIWQFKGKARAFLTVFQQNKNMNFRVEEIKEYCNPLIEIEKHKFRKEKDISDTLREIRFRLKAKRGEFFPILKQTKGWIWLEK